MKPKVLQIMPADRWYGLFFVKWEPYFAVQPIVAFAIVERDGAIELDGITGGLMFCQASREPNKKEKSGWQFPYFTGGIYGPCLGWLTGEGGPPCGFVHETQITEEVKSQWATQAKAFLSGSPVLATPPLDAL